jgi:hypothetical protein
VHRLLAEYPQAWERYDEAEGVLVEIGDRYGVAACRRAKALLAAADGDVPRAIEEMQAAAELLEACGVTVWAARCRKQVAEWQRAEP